MQIAYPFSPSNGLFLAHREMFGSPKLPDLTGVQKAGLSLPGGGTRWGTVDGYSGIFMDNNTYATGVVNTQMTNPCSYWFYGYFSATPQAYAGLNMQRSGGAIFGCAYNGSMSFYWQTLFAYNSGISAPVRKPFLHVVSVPPSGGVIEVHVITRTDSLKAISTDDPGSNTTQGDIYIGVDPNSPSTRYCNGVCMAAGMLRRNLSFQESRSLWEYCERSFASQPRRRIVFSAAAAPAATPWLYASHRSGRIIGSGVQ